MSKLRPVGIIARSVSEWSPLTDWQWVNCWRVLAVYYSAVWQERLLVFGMTPLINLWANLLHLTHHIEVSQDPFSALIGASSTMGSYQFASRPVANPQAIVVGEKYRFTVLSEA